MKRRAFLATSAALAAGGGTASAAGRAVAVASRPRAPNPAGFDPWIEVDAAALGQNARTVARAAGGRPVLAVIKNNAYGLGLDVAGPILAELDDIAGLAVVKAEEALALRDAGVQKPILLMGLADDGETEELVRRDVRLAPFTDNAPQRLAGITARVGRPVPVHLYLDTGMSRLGMPFRRAVPWIAAMAATPGIAIEGTFTALTEEDDFDGEQLERFRRVAAEARGRGAPLGRLHAASSHALFFRGEPALFDMVRPGLALYGAYPAGAREPERILLVPALRLRARVVRVERLDAGDAVSYGRRYVAQRPTWIATLPVGHADGYPRRAVEGCVVLIGDRPYRVIGAVSASHTIVELGAEPTARVGDVATLIGPDHPAVHPNTVAARAGISVYDVLMHLGQRLPRRAVGA